MTKVRITYQSPLGTECQHESGARFSTDAPKDNGGEGNAFSPTDLVGAALGSCIITLMALAARKLSVDLSGTTAEVEKQISQVPPRRVAKRTVHVHSPYNPTPEVQAQLEKAGRTCPVHASLHPDMIQEIYFHWNA